MENRVFYFYMKLYIMCAEFSKGNTSKFETSLVYLLEFVMNIVVTWLINEKYY